MSDPECPYTPEPSKLFCEDYLVKCDRCIDQAIMWMANNFLTVFSDKLGTEEK